MHCCGQVNLQYTNKIKLTSVNFIFSFNAFSWDTTDTIDFGDDLTVDLVDSGDFLELVSTSSLSSAGCDS